MNRECTESTSLLIEDKIDNDESESLDENNKKHLLEDEISKLSRDYRANLESKWFILLLVSTIWLSTFHCILSISALENTLIVHFNLSNTEFAAFTSIVYGVSVCCALVAPHIVRKIGLYYTLVVAQSFCAIGQFIFTLGVSYANLNLMYIGRALLGVNHGLEAVGVNSIIALWFTSSRWSSLAYTWLFYTYEFGILSARYLLIPIKNSSNSISDPFLLGVGFAILGIISSIIMQFIENSLVNSSKTPKYVKQGDGSNISSNYYDIKYFPIQLWLVITYFSIAYSNVDTFTSQMTEVLIDRYGMSEWLANIDLSIISLAFFVLGPFWSFLIAKYGRIGIYQIFSTIFIGISALLFMVSNNHQLTPWLGVCLFAIGVEFNAASAPAVLLLCPPSYISIANAIAVIGYSVGSAVEIISFGELADYTNSFIWSIGLIGILSGIGFVLLLFVYEIDKNNNGKLYKPVDNESN